MKAQSFIRIFGSLLLAFLVSLPAGSSPGHRCASARACAKCPIDVTVMYQHVDVTRIRTGHPGFLSQPGQLWRMYRSYFEEYSHSATLDETNSAGTATYSYTMSQTYPTDGYTPLPGPDCTVAFDQFGPSGTYTFDGSCGTTSADCSDTLTDGEWEDEDCGDLAALIWTGNCWPTWMLVTNNEVTLDDFKQQVTHEVSEGGSFTDMTWTRQLDDEYTIQELVNRIYGDLLGASYPTELTAGGGAGIRYTDFVGRCWEASKMVMHISFWTEKDVSYVVHWTKVERDFVDGITRRTEMSFPVTGNGDLFQTQIEVLPPKKVATTWAENFWAEMIPPNGDGSGGGGAPGDGSTGGGMKHAHSSGDGCGSCGSSSAGSGFRDNASPRSSCPWASGRSADQSEPLK